MENVNYSKYVDMVQCVCSRADWERGYEGGDGKAGAIGLDKRAELCPAWLTTSVILHCITTSSVEKWRSR